MLELHSAEIHKEITMPSNNVMVSVPGVSDGGDFGTGAMAQGLNDFSQRRKDDRMAALGLLGEKKDALKTRYINNAVGNVLSMEPKETILEGPARPGEDRPSIKESPDAYSMRVKHEMGKIHDMDPMVALGLSQKITQPYREQSNADRLFGFNETKEENTQNYRDTVTGQTKSYQDSLIKNQETRNTETAKHNRAMEVPNDIREATQAGYGTQQLFGPARRGESMPTELTPTDFAKYQEDKAKASKTAYQSPETLANLRSNALTRYLKIMTDDEYEAYEKLPASQKAIVHNNLLAGKGSGWKSDSKGILQKSDAGFDLTPRGDVTASDSSLPAGSVDNGDGTITLGSGTIVKKKAN